MSAPAPLSIQLCAHISSHQPSCYLCRRRSARRTRRRRRRLCGTMACTASRPAGASPATRACSCAATSSCAPTMSPPPGPLRVRRLGPCNRETLWIHACLSLPPAPVVLVVVILGAPGACAQLQHRPSLHASGPAQLICRFNDRPNLTVSCLLQPRATGRWRSCRRRARRR